MVLEQLAPICRREKSGIQGCGFFLLEVSLLALERSVVRFSTKAFLPWLDLVCPLLTQAPYLSLPILPLRWSGDVPWVDLMVFQIDFQFLTTKTFV